MGRKRKIKEKNLRGFKHFKLLSPALEHLHDNAYHRDKASNCTLHFDQYAALPDQPCVSPCEPAVELHAW